MAQKSLPRLEKGNVSLFWEQTVISSQERWMPAKIGILSIKLLNLIFHFSFSFYKNLWESTKCKIATKRINTLVTISKKKKKAIRQIKELKAKAYISVASYSFKQFNKNKVLSLYSFRSNMMKAWKRLIPWYNNKIIKKPRG